MLYIGALSWLIQGTDVEAAALLGLPAWPFRLLALMVLIVSIGLIFGWRSQARSNLSRYRAVPAPRQPTTTGAPHVPEELTEEEAAEFISTWNTLHH
jgi:hypothetical protein